MVLMSWATVVYVILCMLPLIQKNNMFFYVLSHSSIRYFLYTGSYSPMLFLMSWAMTISCTHSMWAFTLPDTICFLSPETQQYIHYSLYAQVLISRHNMFLMSWAVALLQYLLFFVWGAIPRHKGIKCTRFVVGSGWSLWPKGIESYVIFSSMDDSFC